MVPKQDRDLKLIKRYTNGRMLRWAVHFLLLLNIYYYTWDYAPWVPWTLLVTGPWIVLSLHFTLQLRRRQVGWAKRKPAGEVRKPQAKEPVD